MAKSKASVNKQFMVGGGEMGDLMRSYDWSKTSLGDSQFWPQSLKTTINILLNSKFPMYLFWGPEHICFYNDAYRPSLGEVGRHPQMLGMKGQEAWPDVWDFIKGVLDDLMLKGESHLQEDQLVPIFRNGRMEDVYWTFCYGAVYNEEGKIGGALINCIETSEKVGNLKRVQEINKEYGFTIEAAELATWDFNPYNRKFHGNDRLRRWFGLSKNKEIELDEALNVIIEEDRERVENEIQQTLTYDSGGHYDIEYTIRNGIDKEIRHVRAIGRVWFNNKKVAYRFSGILLDVTSKKRAELRIKNNEEKFRGLAESLPNLIWMTDNVGKVTFMSKSWESFSGTDASVKENRLEMIHPKDRKKIKTAWDNSLESGKMFLTEVRLKNVEGKYVWHLVKGVPLKNDKNEITNWIGAYTDINEQKLKEQKKDEFISIATHEMKTPLTSAQGYLELLSTTISTEDETSLVFADKARQSVGRLLSFINDLLDVTKIQNGKLNYKKEIFNLNDLVLETIDNSKYISKTHKILKLSTVNCSVKGDRARVLQVLINLISNAIKYSPEKEEVIVNMKEADGFVEVSIQDFGVGMTKKDLKKIFNRYYRAQEHAIKFQGMGIGLFISNEIVKRHKGKMWATSVNGEGSTFYFNLPIAK